MVHYQLLGRDIRVAFKHVDHVEAFADATHAAIADQEEAGLDIVTDGQMCFDDSERTANNGGSGRRRFRPNTFDWRW